jgi:membrane-bound metal-dependent hydrolase YbcI (DUF457 family)
MFMTPVGHSLVGAAVGVVVMPLYKSRWASAAFLAAFVALANLPDWRLPYWGHERYDISHSIFVNLALIMICAVPLRICKLTRANIGAWPVIFGGAIAWLSHLLLDSFYNHGQGIAIFWPFSSARLALPMPWFRTWSSVTPPLNADTFYICLIETLFYSPILLLAIGWRYWRRDKG